MHDVLDAMTVADPNAVQAFVARQSPESVRELPDAAELMRDLLLQTQMQRPDELVAWKTPAQPIAVPQQALQAALSAAVAGERDQLRQVIAGLAFGQLATLQSLAYFIADSARRTLALHHGTTS